MTSHYHHLRKTKRAKDCKALAGKGHRLYGYDFGNDRARHIVPYKLVQKWLESKVGTSIDDIWKAAHQKWNNKTYIGHQTLEYLKFCMEFSRWSTYYVKDGVLCSKPKTRYVRPKTKSKIVNYRGENYFRHNNVWYRVEVRKPEPNKYGYYYFEDVFLGLIQDHQRWHTKNIFYKMYGCAVYCTSKQQVGKRLCRKLNSLTAGEVV